MRRLWVHLVATATIGFGSANAFAQVPERAARGKGAEFPATTRRLPRFEFGGRLQLGIIEGLFGVDLGLRASPNFQVGVMLGYGNFRRFNEHCAQECRDAEWFWLSPYGEARLNADGSVSPYARVAVGLASGNFTHWQSDPGETVADGHAELGLDFHAVPRGVSFRLFLGTSFSTRNENANGSIWGLPGVGAQIGTAF